jgi:hypothetical protein
VTGKLPPSTIAAPNSPAITSQLFKDRLKPVAELMPGTPKPLCELIHRCVEYDAKRRPERVSDVQDELNALIEKLVQTDDDRLESMGW